MAKQISQAEDKLVRFILETTWDSLPKTVQERALICLLDNLMATLAGTMTKSAGIAARYALELFPGEEATLFCTGRRASALGAAFANGVAANALDIDDCGLYTWGHPGAQVFPTALAVSEKLKASGAVMLAATVVGYEVMFRTGRCWYHNDPLLRGCGSWGSTGCAAIAANLYRLSKTQTLNALGIAEFHSPSLPLMRSVDEPAMDKHGIGLGTFTGVMSAELAARGFTGMTSILGNEKYREWVEDIGEEYILPYGISWKDFCCCAWAHPALYGVKKIQAQSKFSSDEVSRIVVEVYEEASHLGVNLPETTEQAQFNLAWPLAVLMIDGEVGIKQILESRLSDERVRNLAAKVELRISEELTRLYENSERGDPEGTEAARVTIELADGRRLESGFSENPPYRRQQWDPVRMEKKFRWLLNGFVPDSAIEELIKTVWTFDQLDNVGVFGEFIRSLGLPGNGTSAE
jgi:2-methylcitrate dehydratase PrpD